jgi:hypothetical protein
MSQLRLSLPRPTRLLLKKIIAAVVELVVIFHFVA